MNLKKKIKYVQFIALGIVLILCILFYVGFTEGTKNGDYIRVSEISMGVRSRLDNRRDDLNDLMSMYSRLYLTSGEYLIRNLENELYDQESFNQKTILFQGIYNEQNSIFNDFYTGYDNGVSMLSQVANIIQSGEEEFNEIIILDNVFYVLNYKKISDSKYIVLFQIINDEYLYELGNSTKSIVYLIENPDLGDDAKKIKIKDVDFVVKEMEDKIYTISKIESKLNNIYFVVEQTKEVQNTITRNFKKFMFLMFGIIIISSILLYIVIYRIIVKRIIKLNDSILEISNKNNYDERIYQDERGDEISTLSTSINSMLNKVQSAKNKIKSSEKKYHNIINSMTNGFIYLKSIYDDKGNIVDGEFIDMNCAAKEMLRIKNYNSLKLSDLIRNNNRLAANVILNLCKLKDNSQIFIDKEIELSNSTWGSVTLNYISINNFYVIINDVTKIKSYSEDMKYFANYDTLTSLYNRRKIINYLNELKICKREFSFYFIDLDNFKKLNDTLGHEEGDKLLKAVAKALLTVKDNSVQVGRFGGDEFVLVKEGNIDEKSIVKFSREILDSINKTYIFDKFTYNLQASIGTATYPIDSNDINEIIKYADIAMYNSKSLGRNRVSIFNKELLEAHELENRIKESIKNNEFQAYFQPIYNVDKKRIDGVEALVRWEWNNDIKGPKEFLEVARRSNILYNIDKSMIIASCKFNREVYNRFGYYLTVSINISNSLLTRKEFVDFILETIESNKIPPRFINIEINESEIIDDMNYIVSILNHLRKIGMKVSLDDFGTGYSTYNYVNLLPLDTIKIDKSLVNGIEKLERNYSIVKSLIELTKSLNLDITCEGVEKEEQLELLSNLGCKRIQGYIFSKPLKEIETIQYIDKINKKINEYNF